MSGWLAAAIAVGCAVVIRLLLSSNGGASKRESEDDVPLLEYIDAALATTLGEGSAPKNLDPVFVRESLACSIRETTDWQRLSFTMRRAIVQEIVDELFGLGPVSELVRDPSVDEVRMDGPRQISVIRNEAAEITPKFFQDDAHLLTWIEKLAHQSGQSFQRDTPSLVLRLHDGSRLTAVRDGSSPTRLRVTITKPR